jgi:hypothetical protein
VQTINGLLAQWQQLARPDLSNAKGRHEAGLFLVVSAKR